VSAAGEKDRASDWRQPHPIWIVGHRGAPRRARENTIESFDWAESLGVDAIEFDVRQTRDGEAVVFHDEEVALGSQRVPVRSFTTREVQRLVLPSERGDYSIPRLQDVFHRYGRALRYVVEVKSSVGLDRGVMARRVAGLAAEYGVGVRCLVASFDAEFLKRMREIEPRLATSYIFDHPVALPEAGRLTPLFPPVDGVAPSRHLATPALIGQAAAAGLSVHPWTVNEREEIRRFLEAGVASITTDEPELALEVRGSPSPALPAPTPRPAG
jgi:glycerophosphoryl diester phosphodiesterase